MGIGGRSCFLYDLSAGNNENTGGGHCEGG